MRALRGPAAGQRVAPLAPATASPRSSAPLTCDVGDVGCHLGPHRDGGLLRDPATDLPQDLAVLHTPGQPGGDGPCLAPCPVPATPGDVCSSLLLPLPASLTGENGQLAPTRPTLLSAGLCRCPLGWGPLLAGSCAPGPSPCPSCAPACRVDSYMGKQCQLIMKGLAKQNRGKREERPAGAQALLCANGPLLGGGVLLVSLRLIRRLHKRYPGPAPRSAPAPTPTSPT